MNILFLAIISGTITDTTLPLYEMEEVVVTATKTPWFLKDIPVSVTVIDSDKIEGMDVKDISNILDNVLSIKTERYGTMGATSGVMMRGCYSSQVLILIDGRPINSPALGGADLSWLSGANVKKIEIVRGPVSNLYGTDAVGGVINIITSNDANKISANYGSWNTFISSLSGGINLKNFDIGATGNIRKSSGERDNSGYDGQEVNSRLEYKFNSGNFIFQTGVYKGKASSPGVKPAEDTTKRYETQKYFGNNEVSSLVDNGRNDRVYEVSNLNIYDLSLSSFVNYWEDNTYREWLEGVGWPTVYEHHIGEDNYTTGEYGVEIQYGHLLWRNLITGGASLTKDKFTVVGRDSNVSQDSTKTNEWGAERLAQAVYLQDEFPLGFLKINLGARLDEASDYPSQISPRVALLWGFSSSARLRVSYGESYRAPTLNDLNWPSDPFSEGNPDLKPEKGNSCEMGIEKAFGENIISRVTLFRQDICDMIRWDAIGSLGPYGNKWYPSNIGRLLTNGIECEWEIVLFKGFENYVNYTYLDAKQKNKELINVNTQEAKIVTRQSAYIPKHKVGIGVEYKIEDIRLNADAQYVSETYNYYQNWDTWPEATMDTKKQPCYTLVRVKGSIKVGKADFSIGLDNLLNTKYAKFGGDINDRDYPLPGRNYTIGINWSL